VKTLLVALLRGINVGTAKRVAMGALRDLVEELGYGDVRTLLNSGNVVFSAARADPGGASLRIAEALKEKLGVSARVTVISARELAEVVASNPLLGIADNPSRLLVGILEKPADKGRLADITERNWGREKIALGAARAVYMWMPDGVINSRVNAAVAKALGDGVTSRNWATMVKLLEMAR
jgi:uncharacterized protein (DUF1697 family)